MGCAGPLLGRASLGGEGWTEGTSPTGLAYYQRELPLEEGAVIAQHVSFCPPGPFGRGHEVGSGGLVIVAGGHLPGELHYRLLRSPVAGTDETVDAVFVNWVEAKDTGRGWASAMYRAVREAHPGWVVPAADVLEGPGRRLVKHYREKYPEVHVGRFDTKGVVHLTAGPQDRLYRAGILEG